jgi:hypothetical protein
MSIFLEKGCFCIQTPDSWTLISEVNLGAICLSYLVLCLASCMDYYFKGLLLSVMTCLHLPFDGLQNAALKLRVGKNEKVKTK